MRVVSGHASREWARWNVSFLCHMFAAGLRRSLKAHGRVVCCMQALSSHHVDRNYYQCWSGLQSHFDRNWLENRQNDSSRQQQQQQQQQQPPGNGISVAGSERPHSNGSPQHGGSAGESNAEESGAQQAANPLCAQARGAS